jgi:hypothetical protein
MSTAQLEINSWVQTENTVAVMEPWEVEEEEFALTPSPEEINFDEEPEPTLPDDFWQEWFGLWR